MTSNLLEIKQTLYFYDLPKAFVTSVKLRDIIKAKTGYLLTEVVNLTPCKPNYLTGIESPFMFGVTKIHQASFEAVCKAMKYFDMVDET